MGKTITIDELKEDLSRAREGVGFWVDELEKRIRMGATAEDRERRICEATRMLLVYGRFLHSLTLVFLANNVDRPTEAWNDDIAARASRLFRRAEREITADRKRRDRVHSRFHEFWESIRDWSPGFEPDSLSDAKE